MSRFISGPGRRIDYVNAYPEFGMLYWRPRALVRVVAIARGGGIHIWRRIVHLANRVDKIIINSHSGMYLLGKCSGLY
jgi:hypothetical protein